MADRQNPTPRRSSSGSGQRRKASPRRPEVIRCENCGEDYSITYKRCPFCDERPGRGGVTGKRVANTRGGGYGRSINPVRAVWLAGSLLLIASALFIVFRFMGAPIFGGGKHPGSVSSSQGGADVSQPVSPNPGGSQTQDPVPTVESIVLSSTEATLDSAGVCQLTAALLPEGVSGEVVWSSSDPSAATVDSSGLVTNVNAGGDSATVTITAACGDVSAQCTVVCKPAAGGGGTVVNGSQGIIINAEKGLNVRSGPGREYDKVASVANGDRVTILGEENGWYQIAYTATKTGYVSKDYVSVS